MLAHGRTTFPISYFQHFKSTTFGLPLHISDTPIHRWFNYQLLTRSSPCRVTEGLTKGFTKVPLITCICPGAPRGRCSNTIEPVYQQLWLKMFLLLGSCWSGLGSCKFLLMVFYGCPSCWSYVQPSKLLKWKVASEAHSFSTALLKSWMRVFINIFKLGKTESLPKSLRCLFGKLLPADLSAESHWHLA